MQVESFSVILSLGSYKLLSARSVTVLLVHAEDKFKKELYMKNRTLFILLTLVLTVLLASIIFERTDNAIATSPVPTAAPKKTQGPPPTTIPSVYSVLEHPLTKEEAIQKAFEYDRRIAKWQEDWSPQTFTSDPNRITATWYKDRSYDGSEPGEGAENGPIWVVTINGNVQLPGEDPQNRVHDGISYQVSQDNGLVWGFVTGPSVSK